MLTPWAVVGEQAAERAPVLMETDSVASPSNAYCFRCHGMGTLSYRDRESGAIVSLQISELQYRTSNHQRLRCVACHRGGFEVYPHPDKARAEHLYCTDCHKQDEKLKPFHFLKIEREFEKSVHSQKKLEPFNCFSCHDPHQFLASRSVLDDEPEEGKHLHREVLAAVAYANNICTECHDSPVRLLNLDPGSPPNFLTAHEWLPSPELHWKKVRCIDCHLAQDDEMLHRILPAEQALKACRECHSRNSLLLGKLYLYSAQQDRERYGFINSVVMNDAYIIGMTRNTLLERISFILMGLTLLAIAAHGLGRWIAYRRRNQ
jgi:hypothetical protein